MDRRMNAYQEEAAGLQEQLGGLVNQTSTLLSEIRKSAAERNADDQSAQSMKIYVASVNLRLRQYADLNGRTERLATALSEAAGDQASGSVTATLIMLRQMMTQMQAEMKSLQGVEEELELWTQAKETDTIGQKISLLDKLKKGLEATRQ